MNKPNYRVYIHTNIINNKSYVGITCQKPENRWKKNGLGYLECPYFWKAIQKYGWHNFSHKILAENLTHEEACDMEKRLIAEKQLTNPEFGYNLSEGGDGHDSDLMIAKWKDEVFRNTRSNLMREAWKDKSKREARSNAAKQRWENPEYKEIVRKAIENVCGKSVTCIETNEVFNTIKDVEDSKGLFHSNITRSIKLGYKCGGYHWKYTDEVS